MNNRQHNSVSHSPGVLLAYTYNRTPSIKNYILLHHHYQAHRSHSNIHNITISAISRQRILPTLPHQHPQKNHHEAAKTTHTHHITSHHQSNYTTNAPAHIKGVAKNLGFEMTLSSRYSLILKLEPPHPKEHDEKPNTRYTAHPNTHLFLEITQLAHLAQPGPSLRKRILQLQDLNLEKSILATVFSMPWLKGG